MASTAADIIASAKAEAEAAKQSALASLSGLGTEMTSAYNQQQSATNALYQNTLDQLQKSYQADTKAAYGNYMSEKQNLNNQLARLGLQNSGYGVSQGLLAGSAYSKNLATLQSALATNKANTTTQQQQALADLYSTYAKNKLSLDEYLYEAGQKAYDTAYSNSYQAQQDEIANALQQQYYNYLMSQGSGGGGYGSGGGYGYDNDYTLDDEVQLSDADTYGTFSNGYQPKGISGHGSLSKTGDKITVNGNKQNVWRAEDGTTWYWDGSVRQYKTFQSGAFGQGKGGGGFR